MGLCSSKDEKLDSINNNLTEKEILLLDSEYSIFDPFNGEEKDAKLLGIVDGDTLNAAIIFNNKQIMIRVRISGIDTPETKGDTEEFGIKAKKAVYDFFGLSDFYDPKVKRLSEKTREKFEAKKILFKLKFNKINKQGDCEKFGRHLASATYKNRSLSEYLIDMELANAYNGGTKDQLKWEKR